MADYKKQRSLISEIAGKLYRQYKVKTSYQEFKETLLDTFQEALKNNSAFVYFAPDLYYEFTLESEISVNKTRLNLGEQEDIEKFQKLCEFFFKFHWEDITGPRRKRELVTARQFVTTWIKKNTDWSLSRVGKFIGGQDHSTIIHSVNAVYNLISVDKSHYSLWKNFNEFINVYIKPDSTPGLGESIEKPRRAVAENRKAYS
jgi:chromosomal replication initiation ATPase DnaA